MTAHRGGSAEAPENTLASIQHGVEIGADIVEFDVRSTSDGILVLMHDARLDRTTNCYGYVTQHTWDEVSRCLTKQGGQPVPSLDQVLGYLATVNTKLFAEIKDYGSDISDSELATFVAALQSHSLVDRTYAQSFDPAVFAKLDALDPTLRTVYLSDTVVLVSNLKLFGADAASVKMSALAKANVDTYHYYKYPVYTWTANTTADLQHAWTLGVDSVGTDLPTAALALYR